MKSKKTRPTFVRLRKLKAIAFDCDGVLTPGDLIYDAEGSRLLRFNAKDGMGLALLCHSNFPVAIISGRNTDIAEKRHREIGITHYYSRVHNKAEALTKFCAEIDVPLAACAFVGDDLPDLPAFSVAGLKIAVFDAVDEVKAKADWITRAQGGQGAAREICDAILKAQRK